MKKIIIAAALILLSVVMVACGSSPDATGAETEAPKKPSEVLIGVWTYELGGYTYTFNADGTGSYDAGKLMKFTYTATDTEITLTYEDSSEPLVLPYAIADNLLTVKDSFGEDTFYVRQKNG